MSDLKVVATIPAAAGSEDVVRRALTTLAAASRLEDGCVDYSVFESAAEPGTFVAIEVWRGSEDHAAHMESASVSAAFAAVEGHLAGAPVIHPLQPVVD